MSLIETSEDSKKNILCTFGMFVVHSRCCFCIGGKLCLLENLLTSSLIGNEITFADKHSKASHWIPTTTIPNAWLCRFVFPQQARKKTKTNPHSNLHVSFCANASMFLQRAKVRDDLLLSKIFGLFTQPRIQAAFPLWLFNKFHHCELWCMTLSLLCTSV